MKFKRTNIFENLLASMALAAIPITAYAQSKPPTFLEQNDLAIAVLVFLYILPSLISYWRKHPSKYSIWIVNILFGWTLIAWIVALIWACGKTTQHVVIVSAANDGASVKTAPTANSGQSKTVAERIADLKTMLDAGTITQSEFDLLKADALKSVS